MAEEIKKGDVVQLKSGSDHMVVRFIKQETAYIAWFIHSTKELKLERINLNALKKVE